ncbi:MAG: phage terminase large subunit [Cyanobacteriota bacterium]
MARNSVAERRRKFAEEAAAEIGLKAEDFGLNVSDRPLTLREFVDRVYPKYKWYRHCEVLADVLQRVADGELKRVLISMPPRHGKSQLATKIFPAYFLYRYPDKWVGVSSYAAELSYTFSRAARECYQDSGGKLREDASAVKHWETVEGGGLWAAGVGGPITGKGFSLGIIDDPLKNQEEAFSDTIRTKQQDWYGSTFYTRPEADGAIVVIQTRWHENDLTGWLLSQEGEDDEPECWHVVNFEAIKEESEREFPVSCTVEPDWRQPGEALCPERYDLKRLRKIAKRIGSYFWNALYQQRPTSADGDVFNIDWFCYYAQLPATFEMLVLSVDATFKESKTSDFVVVQMWGIAWPNLYLIDQVRDRMGFTKTKEAIVALCSRWKPIYGEANAKLIEDKANGSAIIEELKREMPGIIAIEPEGGKLARAQAASPYYEGKNIWLPSGTGWTKDYVAEHIAFPRGTNDDQVDGSTQLVNWIARKYTIKTVSPDFGF